MAAPTSNPTIAERHRAIRLYALGQGAIFVGAGLMAHFESRVPMALGGSAGLMLCTPLIRQLSAQFLRRSPARD